MQSRNVTILTKSSCLSSLGESYLYQKRKTYSWYYCVLLGDVGLQWKVMNRRVIGFIESLPITD